MTEEELELNLTDRAIQMQGTAKQKRPLCTECWLRLPAELFEDDEDICADCKDQLQH